MKRFILLCVIVAICSAAGAQKLVLDRTTVNLDTVELKSRNIFEVGYRNAGDKPLVLKSVTTNCNCTKIKWNKAPLMPGDSAKIEIVFTPATKGVFYKTVFFAPTGDDSVKSLVIRGIVR